MWYTTHDIKVEGITSADAAMVVAFANMLSYHGWKDVDLTALYVRLRGSDSRPLDWQSGENIPGVRVWSSGIIGNPIKGPAIGMYGALPCFMRSAMGKLIVNSKTGLIHPADELQSPLAAWAIFEDLTPPAEAPLVPKTYTENVIEGGIKVTSYGKPRKMYVRNPDGAWMINFGGTINNFRDFKPVAGKPLPYGSVVRIMGEAHHPVPPLGEDFQIPMDPYDVWGSFTRTGKLNGCGGYKEKDLSPTPPPSLQVTAAIQAADVKQLEQPTALDPERVDDITRTFRYLREDKQPVPYQVMAAFGSRAFLRPDAPVIKLHRGTLAAPRIIHILGTFRADGRIWMLPVLDEGYDPFEWYYGVTETVDGTRLIEKVPDSRDVPEIQAIVPKKSPSVVDRLVDITAAADVILIKGVYKLKRHVERIVTWTK